MADAKKPLPGAIAWHDLTVPDADRVRDFYRSVVGWTSEPVDMGGYADHNMIAASTGETVAGICHARGTNADLPARWLMYIIVDDVDQSAARCRELGGKVVAGPRSVGSARYCVIEDPAGAVCALYQP